MDNSVYTTHKTPNSDINSDFGSLFHDFISQGYFTWFKILQVRLVRQRKGLGATNCPTLTKTRAMS